MKNKGFIWLPVLLGVLVVLALGGAYVYETQKPTTPTEPIYTPTISTNTTTKTSATTNASAQKTTTSADFSATPISGTAPLTVTFSGIISGPNPSAGGGIGVYEFSIDFGDNQSKGVFCSTPLPYDMSNYIYPTSCTFPSTNHSYASPGTYTANLLRLAQDGTQTSIGTAKIIVTGNNSTQPETATIESSLITTSHNPTITGSASGVSHVLLGIIPTGQVAIYESGPISIVNGRWSINIPTYLPSGTYRVDVYDPDGAPALTTDTLTVN